MPPIASIDELNADPHLFPRALHATLDDIAHAELTPDVLYPDGLALVGEHGVPGDHQKPGVFRYLDDDVGGDSVTEICLGGITAHVLERQYGNGRDAGRIGADGR